MTVIDQISIQLANAFTWLMANMSLGLAGKFFSLLLIIWMIIEFIKAQRDPKSPIDLNDLFIDSSTGKLGGSKMRLNMAFIVSTWVLIYNTLNAQLSEWLFGAYLAAFVYDRVRSRSASSAAITSNVPAPIVVPSAPPASAPAVSGDDDDMVPNLPQNK
jgi:hypothetical protein